MKNDDLGLWRRSGGQAVNADQPHAGLGASASPGRAACGGPACVTMTGRGRGAVTFVLGERPARILLMDEDDGFQDCRRDAHHLRHQLVEIGALVREASLLIVLIKGLQRRLESLVLTALRLLGERERALADGGLSERGREFELDLRLHLRATRALARTDACLLVGRTGSTDQCLWRPPKARER